MQQQHNIMKYFKLFFYNTQSSSYNAAKWGVVGLTRSFADAVMQRFQQQPLLNVV